MLKSVKLDTDSEIIELNEKMKLQKEKYIFHFLSPNGYDVFFNHLRDGSVLEDQKKFRCQLENLLEEN